MLSNKNILHPSDIPTSYIPINGQGNLFHLAGKKTFIWVDEIFEKLKNEKSFHKLEKEFGHECFEMLVKKQLWQTLVPVARKVFCYDIFQEKFKYVPNDFNVDNPEQYYLVSNYLNINYPLKKITIIQRVRFSLIAIKNVLSDILSHFLLSIFSSRLSCKKIGVELKEDIPSFDYPSTYEMNWWDKEKISSEDIIFFYVMNLDHDNYKKLMSTKNKGVTLVSLNRYVKFGKSLTLPTTRPYFIPRTSFLSSYYLSWKLSLKWWDIFFDKFNISTYMTMRDFSLDPIFQRASLEKKNGVSIFRQRSEYHLGGDTLAYNPSHVFCCWGEGQQTYSTDHYNLKQTLLPIGHNFGFELNSHNKNDYFEPEEKFNIVIFDNTFGNKGTMIFEEYERLCSELFEWANKKENVKLIFKPKRKSYLQEFRKYKNFKEMEKKGNIVELFFPPNKFSLSYFKKCDLFLGVMISSSVLEFNIMKKRGIHFFPGSNNYHSLCSSEIVYKSTKEIILALENVYTNPKNSKVGFLSNEHLLKIDCFHDDKGPERLCNFLKILHDTDNPLENLNSIIENNYPFQN